MANLLMCLFGWDDLDLRLFDAAVSRSHGPDSEKSVDGTSRKDNQGTRMMDTWYQIAALSVGGVLGVNARYWLGFWINRWAGSQFPWATFTINVTGSFAIGLCTAFLGRWSLHPHARLVVVVGFLGGYTTFSSYSFESLALWERGDRILCLSYIFGSVAGGLAGVVLGTAVGRRITQG